MGRIFGAVTIASLLMAGTAFAQTPAVPSSPCPVGGTCIRTAAGTAAAPALSLPAGTVEQSPEYRFQLDFHVNDAALAKLLPAGWVSNAATTGAAKDANIRLIFIDRQDITGPDNKVQGKGSDRLVYVAAPVKKSDGSATGQMILMGISESGVDTSGLFGKVTPGTSVSMNRSDADQNGVITATEDWSFTGRDGSQVQMHVKYTRSSANRSASATNFFDPASPAQFFVFTTQQATDITRNVTTTPPDRVAEFTYKVSGGAFAALFDGTEKPLSWDSQPTYNRIVSTGQ